MSTLSSSIPTSLALTTTVQNTTTTTTATTTTATTTTSLIPPTLSSRRHRQHSRLFPKIKQQSIRPNNFAVTAKSNNASVGGSSSGAAPKPEASSQEIKNGKSSSKPVVAQASEESISEFLAQVTILVKLVDSRDIVELQMKQSDCEIIIRKKEAIIPAPPAPMVMMQSPSPQTAAPPAPPTPPAPPPPPPPVQKPSTSSVPALKSPMAGTFYQSPSPGAPTFVKVGDKVQKGQVLCIIEAMKLMNEIEADQSGTVVEVLAEDGKPVSLDTPLFAIQP